MQRCWDACCISCFLHMPKGSPVKNAHEFGHGFFSFQEKDISHLSVPKPETFSFMPTSLVALLSGTP